MDTVLTGKEACMKTIGRWEINGNGIFRKELYQKLFDNREVTTVNSDEYDTRFYYCMLLKLFLVILNIITVRIQIQ